MKLDIDLPAVATSDDAGEITTTYGLHLIGDEEELQINVLEDGMTGARARIEICDGCVKLHVWNRGHLSKDSPDRTITLLPRLDKEEWEEESEEGEELPYPPPPPSHCYLGFLPCGCLSAVSSAWEDWPVLNDAEAVAQFARSGLTVKYVTFEEYRASGLEPWGCQCGKSKVVAEQLGLEKDEMAFYYVIGQNCGYGLSEQALCDLVHDAVQAIKANINIDWTMDHRSDVQAKMRIGIKQVLRRHLESPADFDLLVQSFMQEAKTIYANWPQIELAVQDETR